MAFEPAAAQVQPIPIPNAGFEQGEAGAAPPDWGGNLRAAAPDAAQPAYRAVIDTANPRAGRASVRVERVAGSPAGTPPFASLANRIDATPYRGRRIRLTGAVRAGAPAAELIGLWLRIDRAQGRRGFFDNMSDRPIRASQWADYGVEGDVAPDAEFINFGLLLAGQGQAWLDEVRLENIGPAVPAPASAASPGALLDEAIGLLREHHINSGSADWGQIIAAARTRIAGATQASDAYEAIQYVIGRLGEQHTMLRPAPPQGRTAGARQVPPSPSYALIDGRFGLVRLPAFVGTIEQGRAYVQTLRTGLTDLDRRGVCGWVVDLRGNGGGNMWPMLNGLDPLLGAAPFGSFRQPSGTQTYWVRAEGNVRPGSTEREQPPAFRLRGAARPLAVLIDSRTSSSGEMTAIALVGRGGVRTFGAPSTGFTTANSSFPLADGALLVITTAHVRDRTGHEYRGSMTPDEPVDPEAAVAAALRWLAGQPCPAAD